MDVDDLDLDAMIPMMRRLQEHQSASSSMEGEVEERMDIGAGEEEEEEEGARPRTRDDVDVALEDLEHWMNETGCFLNSGLDHLQWVDELDVLSLARNENAWQHAQADVLLLMGRYATPRARVMRVLWQHRHDQRVVGVLQITHPHILHDIHESMHVDYKALRTRWVGGQAAGFLYMSAVQRSTFYSLWTSMLLGSALMVDLRAREAGQQAAINVMSASDFDWVRRAQAATRMSIDLMPGVPLYEYTLRHCYTALQMAIAVLDMHGMPRALGPVQPYWEALWMRIAIILALGAQGVEKDDAYFYEVDGCWEDVALETDSKRTKRFPMALPYIAGGKRLRLSALERFESLYHTWQTRLDIHDAYERAATASEADFVIPMHDVLLQRAGGRKTGTTRAIAALLAFVQRTSAPDAGSTRHMYVRDEFSRALCKVYLRPGENELYYINSLHKDPSAPPYEAAPPQSDEVIYHFRGDAYDRVSHYFNGTVWSLMMCVSHVSQVVPANAHSATG